MASSLIAGHVLVMLRSLRSAAGMRRRHALCQRVGAVYRREELKTMLSGNPDTFAVWCDAVDAWSSERFANGCMGYFVDGRLMWSTRSTLGVDLHQLSGLHCMTHAVEDQRLFDLPATLSYAELCRHAFPSMDSGATHSDWRYLASPASLLDDGYNFFIVESGQHARLIYGNDNTPNVVGDVVLKRGEFQAVVREAVARFGRGTSGIPHFTPP